MVFRRRLRDGSKNCEAVRGFKEIKNARQAKSWLGLCGYYRKFCEGFSDIVAPIQKLTVQGVPFVWSSEAERAREEMVEKLCSYPILRYFNVTRPGSLYTHASYCSIGVVLGQIDEQGYEYVCEYFGRALRKHEMNYSVSEIELLFVVEASMRFRVYLASQKFKIIVDHKAWTSMKSIKSPTWLRLQRWTLFNE